MNEQVTREPVAPALPLVRGWVRDRATALVGAAQRLDAWRAALVATFGVAVLVRGRHVLLAGSPVNDGGMFAAMSADIQRAGYALPAVTTYNDAGIPFAYPPLALCLAALVDDLTPLSMQDVYWLLPLAGASLAVVAFHSLARTVFTDRLTVLVATAAFALVPRSFEWLVMGGGLTRGAGLAAALAALAAFRTGLAHRSSRRVAVATVLAAATLLTHMEAAVFLASGVALSAIERRGRWTLAAWAGAAVGAAAIAAPWWVTVLVRHGLRPFLASADHGGTLLSSGRAPLWIWQTVIDPVFTAEPFFSFVGALGALGALLALAHGRWMLPAWWAVLIVIHMRSFATFTVVPTALLAAFLVVEVVLPAAREAMRYAHRPEVGRWRVGLVGAAALGVVLYGAVEPNRGEARFLRPVAEGDQLAMRWISIRTPEDARFLVIPRREWFGDREGEWFPVLAGRESVATPQGLEWVGGAFEERVALHALARSCASQGADCLEALAEDAPFTFVYLPAGCCTPLRNALRDDPRYVARYLGRAAVFERTTPPPNVPADAYTAPIGAIEEPATLAPRR